MDFCKTEQAFEGKMSENAYCGNEEQNRIIVNKRRMGMGYLAWM
jgi:hypothetical protein